MNFYLVGGCVRDQLLGLKPKDIDIAVEASSWEEFREEILLRTTQVFCEEPQYFRIKALNPRFGAVDYVMCRKDGFYTDGRRPDSVEICSIHEDLARRDFTINAIAKDLRTGEILDPFQGQMDIQSKTLRFVGEASDRLTEDGLRWFRAIRFCICKGFELEKKTRFSLADSVGTKDEIRHLFRNISTDRIRDELRKCLFHSTTETLYLITEIAGWDMLDFMSERGIWLNPTTQKKAGNGE